MKNRLFALACHFGISAAVVSIVIGTIIWIWYPPPFFYTQGLFKILIVLVSVDLVLGPLLTFIVFKPGKKGLKFDFVVIALIQFSALFYGIYQTYTSRPVYVVYVKDRFEVVSQNEYIETYLKKAPPNSHYLNFSLTGPRWVGALLPKSTDRYEKEEIEFSETFGAGLRIMPKYYVEFEVVKSDALQSGIPADEINYEKIGVITGPSSEDSKKVKDWISKLSLSPKKIALIPMNGYAKSGIVAMNKDTGLVIGTLSVKPWWLN